MFFLLSLSHGLGTAEEGEIYIGYQEARLIFSIAPPPPARDPDEERGIGGGSCTAAGADSCYLNSSLAGAPADRLRRTENMKCRAWVFRIFETIGKLCTSGYYSYGLQAGVIKPNLTGTLSEQPTPPPPQQQHPRTAAREHATSLTLRTQLLTARATRRGASLPRFLHPTESAGFTPGR